MDKASAYEQRNQGHEDDNETEGNLTEKRDKGRLEEMARTGAEGLKTDTQVR
jgi:hypothetical protein